MWVYRQFSYTKSKGAENENTSALTSRIHDYPQDPPRQGRPCRLEPSGHKPGRVFHDGWRLVIVCQSSNGTG
jgi:hypothetical protein